MSQRSPLYRPALNIEKAPVDRLLEFLAASALALLWGLTAYHYLQLPERIPIHFNASGQPDGWGHKSIAWVAPIIAALLYAMLSLALRYPHRLNYLVTITAHNAERQYRLALRMLRILNLCVMAMFLFVVWHSIQAALREGRQLPEGLLLALLAVVMLTMVWYLMQSSRPEGVRSEPR